MVSCKEVASLLSAYLERDLPPETCQGIEGHLESCPACKEAASGIRTMIHLCREFRHEARPGPLAPEKHQELRRAFEQALGPTRT